MTGSGETARKGHYMVWCCRELSERFGNWEGRENSCTIMNVCVEMTNRLSAELVEKNDLWGGAEAGEERGREILGCAPGASFGRHNNGNRY